MRHMALMKRFVAPMGAMLLLVGVSGNEEADCTPTPTVPEVECAAPVDCEGLPHDLCLDGGWQCIDGVCNYECEPVELGCYSDQDCPNGKHCSVSDGDCQAPPGCPMCTVCYGECVPDETECVQSGCSGEVCAEEAVFTTCIWLDWYECLKLTTCGNFGPDGTCGFEQNDAFLACLTGETACTTDADCPEGFVCEIDSWCGEDAWCADGGKCVPAPKPECETDKDCETWEFCDHSPWDEMVGCCVPLDADGTGCPEDYPICPGECKMKPGMCFEDLDCKDGQHCEGAIPPCDCPDPAVCKCMAPEAGKCVDDQPMECKEDLDCDPGQYCQYTCGNGWCASHCAPVPDGTCVKDADCVDAAGNTDIYCKKEACPACEGCPCFGTCEKKDLPEGMCWTDSDCKDDEYCEVTKCDPATGAKCIGPYECKPKPVEGCTSDKDCEEYEYCDFVVYDGTMDCCPPNTFCDSTIPPCEGGECRLKPGYCWTDDDCGFGEQCEGVLMTNCGDPTNPDVNCVDGDWPGKCAQVESECMADSDCPPGNVCVLETWCPPCTDEDPPCLAPCLEKGYCEPEPTDKCYDDADCKDGQYCDFGAWQGDCCLPGELCLAIYPACEGVCKDKELPPGECWDDGDCKTGEHCEGAIICPPGAYCFVADTPGKCVPDEPNECVAVKPGSHGACEMLLGVIWDGEKCVYESGCGCWPDCEHIFDSFEACEKACQTEPPPTTDCMSQEDCPSGEYCDLMNADQTICIDCVPEATDCTPGCFPVGQCEPLPAGSCIKDADCQPWQQCAFIYPCPLCLDCPCFGVCQDLPD